MCTALKMVATILENSDNVVEVDISGKSAQYTITNNSGKYCANVNVDVVGNYQLMGVSGNGVNYLHDNMIYSLFQIADKINQLVH